MMSLLKYTIAISIVFNVSDSLVISSYRNTYSSKFGQTIQDTTIVFRFRAKLIDTVKEYKMDKLCDHCAMAIRFHVEPSYLNSQYVDIVIFNPDFKTMKLDKVGEAFSIRAVSKYKGPSTLIVPAVAHKNEVPLLWCDSIAPNF